MATSGLLVFAKDKHTHKAMQQLFATRQVEKRYIAILDGIIDSDEGTISLPLTIDPLNRPLQVVDHKHGKEAITHYRVLERVAHTTRVALYPVTGRTHQLRVHMAHPEGLNIPIVGDTLYGKPSTRLMLHAESITFCHPITGKVISITSKAEF
jgi:tRNA pseudouridine32 synthase/23S rRNA pseudouridine746 synthase